MRGDLPASLTCRPLTRSHQFRDHLIGGALTAVAFDRTQRVVVRPQLEEALAMQPWIAIAIIAGTTGLVAYLATRRKTGTGG